MPQRAKISIPQDVPRFSTAPQKIACGFYHSAAIRCNKEGGGTFRACGEAYTWGRNKYNALCIPMKEEEGEDRGPPVVDFEYKAEAAPQKAGEFKNANCGVYEVACGTHHTVFLVRENDEKDEVGGVVWCAGLGDRGRLGIKSRTLNEFDQDTWCTDNNDLPDDRYLAIEPFAHRQPHQQLRIRRIACGAEHTLALSTNCRLLFAWGANDEGQCGVDSRSKTEGHSHSSADHYASAGPVVASPTPVALEDSLIIHHFAAGMHHSLAALETGQFFTWGCGKNGRLGHGNTLSCSSPKACSNYSESKVVYVAGGEAHSAAVDAIGTIYMWGAGSYGRLGLGEANIDLTVPRRLSLLKQEEDLEGDKRITWTLALGGFHTLFLKRIEDKAATKGSDKSKPKPLTVLYACGSGPAAGLKPSDDFTPVSVPTQLELPISGATIEQIAAGMFHSAALTEFGNIITWGAPSSNRLGHAAESSTGEPAVLRDFGSSSEPLVLLHESEETEDKTDDGDRGQSWEVAQLACGALHTVARTEGGEVYAWGCNVNGQTGLGDKQLYQWDPKKVLVHNRKVAEVAVGYEHCIVITQYAEELFTWGRGTEGQLGTGYARDEFTPVHIRPGKHKKEWKGGALSAAAGEVHSVVIAKSEDRGQFHSLWVFGQADGGLLGLGPSVSTGLQTVPCEVPRAAKDSKDSYGSSDLHSPLKVRCGQNHTMLICGPKKYLTGAGMCELGVIKDKNDKNEKNQGTTVWVFGNGWHHRLGLTGLQNVYTPTQVMNKKKPLDGTEAACGADHSCVIDGKDLWVWGKGQMICEQMDVSAPKKFIHIEGKPSFRMVVCGSHHTMVITESGEVYAWGDNSGNQLGQTAETTLLTPLLVKFDQGEISLLATGSAHSIAVFKSGETYAWGASSCGRLGLQDGTKSVLALSRQTFEPKPKLVNAAWTASVSSDGAAGSSANSKLAKIMAQQKVSDFEGLRSILCRQDDDCQEQHLKKKENSLNDSFKKVLEEIQSLGEKEKALRQLDNQLKTVLNNTLAAKNRKLVKLSNDSGVQACAKDIPEFVAPYMEHLQNLVKAFQLQTSYLPRLARLKSGDNSCEEDLDLIVRVVERLYANSSSLATDLFFTLLRGMADMELDQQKDFTTLLADPSTSVLCKLFKNLAFSEAYVKTLVHQFVLGKESKEAKDSKTRLRENMKESMIGRLAESANGSFNKYATSKEVFKKLGFDDKDEQELSALYSLHLNNFKLFLEGPFVESIKQVTFPTNIKGLFSHMYLVLSKFSSVESGDGVTKELRLCEPLLRLVLTNVIIPLLEQPDDYLNPDHFFDQHPLKSVPGGGMEDIHKNMTETAAFLKLMMKNKWEPKQRVLENAAKVVRPALLAHILSQIEVNSVEELEVNLVVDMYNVHFSYGKSIVSMDLRDLLRVANMITPTSFYRRLRVQEADALETCAKALRPFTDDELDQVNGVLVNFSWDPRFLDQEKDVTMCQVAHCPLPHSLCSSNNRPSPVKTYTPVEHGETPQRVLEALLMDKEMTEPLDCKTFKELQVTLTDIRDRTQGIQPTKLQKIDKALAGLEALMQAAVNPEDTITAIVESSRERERHAAYLRLMEARFRLIKDQQERYLKGFPTWKVQFERFLKDCQAKGLSTGGSVKTGASEEK